MKRLILPSLAILMMACQPTKQETFSFDEMTYSPRETVFKLFAPADAECVVVVDKDSVSMTLGADSIWTATLRGNHKGQTYQFLVNGQASPGVFAKAVTVNGEKGVIVDMKDTNPEGWETDQHVLRPYQDIIIYEMHHRDFSIARQDAKHPGKFLALTEPWAIEHLQQLGVNAVHLLPSYDFGSVDETRIDPDLYYEHAYENLPEGVIPAKPDFSPQYNWGYDPVNYNVPEGSYSTDPYDPLCRIREFKQMVQTLHKAGISVILDVVYNHTYDIDHSNFQRTYPDYYYRKDAQGSYSNGSGCGNETASERPMMRRFMIESVRYWIQEYHIDGFRFDLMGVHDIETMNAIRQAVNEIDPGIFLYGEGWSASQCALPTEQLGVKANVSRMPGIAAFCDDMRDGLRGPFSDDTKPAFLNAEPDYEESIKFGIVGAIQHPQIDMSKVNYSDSAWAKEPTQMIAYVSCHDDMCLTDRLRASISEEGRVKSEKFATALAQGDGDSSLFTLPSSLITLDLLAQTAVITSQGVPFMLCGEELLRSKKGVHNSYESPDSINQLPWDNLQRYPQVFDYYSRLIHLRKHHPAFRLGKADLVRRHLEFLDAPAQTIAYRLSNHAGGDDWDNIIVILNANRKPTEVAIPNGQYTIVCQNGQIDEKGLDKATGDKVVVAPQSALIIHD